MEEKMIYDAAIIGTGPAGISAAITLKIRNKNVLLLGSRNLSSKVTYVPLYDEEPKFFGNIEVLHDVLLRIEGDMKARRLILKNTEIEADGIFIMRESISPKQVVAGLKVEDNHILVNRNMETNIPGIFACGDITGLPYQYIKAAGEGNVAALSAVKYL